MVHVGHASRARLGIPRITTEQAVGRWLALNFSRLIDPAGIPRVASTDPPDAFCTSPDGAVFLNGLDHVIAAGRSESAIAAKNWAQEDLVQAHAADHDPPGNSDEADPKFFHCVLSIFRLIRLQQSTSDFLTR